MEGVLIIAPSLHSLCAEGPLVLNQEEEVMRPVV